MEILYIGNKEFFDKKLDRNRYHSLKAIENSVDKFYYWGKGWEDYDDEKTVIDNIKNRFGKKIFDCILTYKPSEYKGFPISSPICCTFNEMYNPKKVYPDLNNINFALCHHSNELNYYRRIYPHMYFKYLAHCANSNIFKPLNIEKKYDFVLVGKLNNKIYPLRARLDKKVFPILTKMGYKCLVHKHPGYNITNANNEDCIKEYVKIINQARICCSGSSCYKYRLSKYIEIPMCRTAFAGDIPLDDANFFRKFMIEINLSMTPKQIANKLVDFLKNKNLLNKMAETGYKMCLDYTQEKYAKRFIKELNKFKNKGMHKIYKELYDTKFKISDTIETLNINKEKHIQGQHSFWFPKRNLKIPFQYKGKITKYIIPKEKMYDRNFSLNQEITLFTILNKFKMTPKIKKIVYIKNFITNYPKKNSCDNTGCIGYIMENAKKLPRGNFDINKMKLIPIKMSKGAIVDTKKNIINGYLVDLRRTGWDNYYWCDYFTMINCDFTPPGESTTAVEPVDEAAVVEPAADEPAAVAPAADEPAADEPAADEPAADEPAADEPAADEPAADEPAADEPAADEPAADEPAVDDGETYVDFNVLFAN